MNELAAAAWSYKDDLCEIIIHAPKFLIGSASGKQPYQGAAERHLPGHCPTKYSRHWIHVVDAPYLRVSLPNR